MNIYEKIALVMKEVQYIQKTQEIKDRRGFVRYRAVPAHEVVKELRQALLLHRLVVLSGMKGYEYKEVTIQNEYNGKIQISVQWMITITMEFVIVNIDDPTEKIEKTWTSCGLLPGDKSVQAAITNGLKYFLLTFFMVPTADEMPEDFLREDDEQQPPPQQKPPAQTAAPNTWTSDNAATVMQQTPQQQQQYKSTFSQPLPDIKKTGFEDEIIPDDYFPRSLKGRNLTGRKMAVELKNETWTSRDGRVFKVRQMLHIWADSGKADKWRPPIALFAEAVLKKFPEREPGSDDE